MSQTHRKWTNTLFPPCVSKIPKARQSAALLPTNPSVLMLRLNCFITELWSHLTTTKFVANDISLHQGQCHFSLPRDNQCRSLLTAKIFGLTRKSFSIFWHKTIFSLSFFSSLRTFFVFLVLKSVWAPHSWNYEVGTGLGLILNQLVVSLYRYISE